MNVAVDSDAEATLALLRESIERYTTDHYAFEQRGAALASDLAYSEQAWGDYASLGWLALRLPEEYGGLAADARAVGRLMEAVGARLLLEPILASAILGTGLVLRRASAMQQTELLPRLADGTLRLALAYQEALDASGAGAIACEYRDGALYGGKIASLHADCADRLIVSAKNARAGGAVSLYIVPSSAPGLERQCFRLLDGRGAANVRFDGVKAEPLDAPGGPAADEAALVAALEEAAVALCSETYGAIRALNAAAVRYLQERKQFGRPIGANQALQHRMVEMYMLEQEVRAVTLAAERALMGSEAARAKAISGARAYACGAARRIAAEAVQMHGGMGVSDELDVSHYYRRLMVVGTLFGNRDFHLARFMAACAMRP